MTCTALPYLDHFYKITPRISPIFSPLLSLQDASSSSVDNTDEEEDNDIRHLIPTHSIMEKHNKQYLLNNGINKEKDFTIADSKIPKIIFIGSESSSCLAQKSDVIEILKTKKMNKKPKIKKKKAVTFDHIDVRTYQLVLGDHPSIKFPLSLGWEYSIDESMKVDAFEARKVQQKKKEWTIEIQLIQGGGFPHSSHQHDLHFSQQHNYAYSRTPKYSIMNNINEKKCNTAAANNEIQPLDMNERCKRLLAVGYSETSLRGQERRRKVQLALETVTQSQGECSNYNYTLTYDYNTKFIHQYILI